MPSWPVDLEEVGGTRYDIVVVAATRAQQIKDGARPLVEVDSNNPLTIALHEIAAGKVIIKPSELAEEEQEPQRVERHYLAQRGDLKQVIEEGSADEAEEAADEEATED